MRAGVPPPYDREPLDSHGQCFSALARYNRTGAFVLFGVSPHAAGCSLFSTEKRLRADHSKMPQTYFSGIIHNARCSSIVAASFRRIANQSMFPILSILFASGILTGSPDQFKKLAHFRPGIQFSHTFQNSFCRQLLPMIRLKTGLHTLRIKLDLIMNHSRHVPLVVSTSMDGIIV